MLHGVALDVGFFYHASKLSGENSRGLFVFLACYRTIVIVYF